MSSNWKILAGATWASLCCLPGCDVPPDPGHEPPEVVSSSQALSSDPVCGSDIAIECSAHLSVMGYDVVGTALWPFNTKFYSACARHDYCYRYGQTTYGYTRQQCDSAFHEDMKDLCSTVGAVDVATGGATIAACYEAAGVYYGAVVALGGDSYKTGADSGTCRYEGWCPPGRFATTGIHHGCACKNGAGKVYEEPLKQFAYCPGTTACPSGRFETTSSFKGCSCPAGSSKKYSWDTITAWCEGAATCPGGTFATTGQHRGCRCPSGTSKDYSGLFDSHATCKGPENYCPSGRFWTTGTHKGCKCRPPKKKKYHGLFDERAECK